MPEVQQETQNTDGTTKQTNKERIKAIVAGIEDGIQKLFQSDRYADYLRTMSRFHSYSVNNTVLIHLQKPNATLVAGFSQWKKRFSRHVKKGETGITIIAPTPFKKKVEEMKLDPDTNEPMYDADGKLIMEERTIEIPMFKPVKVFDLAQTEGKPLTKLSADLIGDVQQYDAFMEALRRSAPVPIELQPIEKSMDGYFSQDEQKIVVRTGMSQVQTVCATIHEIGHSVLHNREQTALADAAGTDKEPPKPKDKNTMEVEAESVSYSVCSYYQIETAANSFGYIASWSKDKSLPELRASLETITKTANALITSIDKNFAEICKERGITLTERVEENAQQEQEQPAEDVPAIDQPAVQEDVPTIDMPVLQEDGSVVGTPSAQEESAELKTVPRDNSSELFADDFCAYLEQLFNDDMIEDPFSAMEKERLAPEIANLLRDGIFDGTRETLSDALDRTGDSTAKSLLTRLEKLEKQWEASLTYEMKDYPLSSGEQDKSCVCCYKPTDLERKDGDILFVGPTGTCQKLVQELRDGTMTRAQAEAMREQWTEAKERKAEIENLPSQEVLYLLDGAEYVHIQASDAGFDYSVYNAETLRLIDGGQFAAENALHHTARDPMEAACQEVCILQGLDPDTVEAVSLELLEKIEAANALPEQSMEIKPADNTADLPDTALDEYPLPDTSMGENDLRECGYEEDDLLPLSSETAKELLSQDFSVYAIADGGQAELCFDMEDIEASPADAVFAVPREEWEQSTAFKEAVDGRMDRQEQREQAFLAHPSDCFAIYQVKLTDDLRFIRYISLDSLEKQGESPTRSNYDLVYTAPLPDGTTLNTLWEKFNIDHPADYRHPSMSVSDIVAMKQDGVLSCYYVDRFGFAELPNFLENANYLKNAELALEDDANMIDGIINNGTKPATAAEWEQRAKSGEVMSIMDLYDAIQSERKANGPEKAEKNRAKQDKAPQIKPEQQKQHKKALKKSAERDR